MNDKIKDIDKIGAGCLALLLGIVPLLLLIAAVVWLVRLIMAGFGVV